MYSEKDKRKPDQARRSNSVVVSVYLHNIDGRQARRENKAIVRRPVLCKQYLYIHKISIAEIGKSVHMRPLVTPTPTNRR